MTNGNKIDASLQTLGLLCFLCDYSFNYDCRLMTVNIYTLPQWQGVHIMTGRRSPRDQPVLTAALS